MLVKLGYRAAAITKFLESSQKGKLVIAVARETTTRLLFKSLRVFVGFCSTINVARLNIK